MWWRVARSQFTAQRGEGNKQALKRLAEAGEALGLLAYIEGHPVGWCAVGPREGFPVLERSRILKRVDDIPVWSIVCFFVNRRHRGKGLTIALLRAAIAYAKQHGARVVEGYPVEPKTSRMPELFAYTGLASAFQRAGFVEVLRRSDTRPIMRYSIGE
jgi:GNAT superfamily N-acetyltransferase